MNLLLRLRRTPRLILLSVVLGIVGGLAAQLFEWLLDTAERLLLTSMSGYQYLTAEQAHDLSHAPAIPHWLWLIPVVTTLGGLLSGWLVYTFAPEAEGHGTDSAVKAFHQSGGKIRGRIPLVKSVASAITIGSGGSAGREGPTAQIAAGIGSIVATFFRLPADERRYVVLMGMAAGLSAIFQSPLGTAIFAVEILYSSMAFEGEALLFTLIASAVAYAVTGLFEGFGTAFLVTNDVTFYGAVDLVWFAALGLVCGAVGALLPTVFYRTRDAFQRLPLPPMFRPALGGLILGIIGIFLPQLLGGGYGIIQLALDHTAGMTVAFLLLLALAKIVALSLTVGSGGSGGVFAPSLYVGALLGASLAGLFQLTGVDVNATALAVVGMAALFAGAARVPIANLVMVTEMTGGYGLIVPTMVAVAISFVIQSVLTRGARYPTLYEAQVESPAESPVHHEEYYRATAKLLRRRQVQLEEDILRHEFITTLAAGKAVPLANGSNGNEALYSFTIPEESSLLECSLRELHLANVLFVSVIRDTKELIPNGDTVLRAGDQVVIAATPTSVADFRKLLAGRGASPTAVN